MHRLAPDLRGAGEDVHDLCGWQLERVVAELAFYTGGADDVALGALVTDVVPFDEAPHLFAELSARRRHVITAVLRAPEP